MLSIFKIQTTCISAYIYLLNLTASFENLHINVKSYLGLAGRCVLNSPFVKVASVSTSLGVSTHAPSCTITTVTVQSWQRMACF